MLYQLPATTLTFVSETVCSALDKMIDGKTPPDVVLDATQTGDATDAIKSLTKSQCYKTVFRRLYRRKTVANVTKLFST